MDTVQLLPYDEVTKSRATERGVSGYGGSQSRT
jgi:hypothetical protein